MSQASSSSGSEQRRSAARLPYQDAAPVQRPAGSDYGRSASSTPMSGGGAAFSGMPPNFPAQAVHFGQAQSHAGSVGDDLQQQMFGSEASFAQGPASGRRDVPPLSQTSVHMMPDYAALNGSVLLGAGIQPVAPDFTHGNASSNGWVTFADAKESFGERPFIPARAMCINIPAECFTTDASKFVDWTTPTNNSVRAASIAALLGLITTPLSKGWLSGAHEEVARQEATARAGDDQDGVHGEAEVKKPKRVDKYMQQDPNDPNLNTPMVCIGVEDIYDADKATVLAIRVWHFVFDPTHSTAELARRLMDESSDEAAHSGAAHQQNNLRKTTVVAAAKASRGLIGSSIESAKLESAAGMVYRHITNESVFKCMLPHYGGRSDKGEGRPPIDLKALPRGTLNRRLFADPVHGCTHPLGPEWVFNAKRPDGLAAGLVHIDGTLMNVHPDQLRVDSYFDVTQPRVRPNAFDEHRKDDPENGDSHAFRVPDWVAAAESTRGDGGGRGCFFFQTDPNQLNIFDMTLPHAIVGAIRPGWTLQRLFKETILELDADDSAYPIGSAALLNRFNNEMTGRDQWEAEAINAMADSMVGFDTFDCSTDQRLDARTAKRNAAKGLASYGQRDGDDHVIEPRQALKEQAFTTSAVHAKIVAPWAAAQKSALQQEEQDLREANDFEHAAAAKNHPVFAATNAKNREFKTTYAAAVKELINLHIAKVDNSFNSAFERESIPVGYRAVYDGLLKELREMPEGTANIAVAQDMQLVDSNRTVFGTLMNWIGTFFEDDCYVDGRSWGLMQELFFHCFEQFDEQTLLLIFCGPKGNGKTLRTERAQKAFVDGWIVMSGPSSAKSGMQGNSDSCNGCNCVYDEMIDELTAGDGDARIEYWKQILLKREFNYMKAVVVRGADGREMHRTYKLRTPHQETHVVCTNRGPAFTRGSDEPSDGKQALLDRSIVLFVRTEGKKTHDDAEFETNMAHPEVRRKVRTFRILTCLTGLLKLLIFRQPFMRPDFALAQKMWDHWDERLDRKFGLPRPSPRKNVKRLSNLTTMCCLNAVAHVFMYKQTALEHDAGQTTEKYPKGKPFEMKMLAQCVPLLQPSPEMIHMAWTMGLEYNIGTSAMGMCGMSIIAEAAGRRVGDWFTRLPAELSVDGKLDSFVMKDSELIDHAGDAEADGGRRRPWHPPDPNVKRLPELEKLFDGEHTVTFEECRLRREQLRKKREMREEYKFYCSRGEMQNVVLRDAEQMLNDAIFRSSPTTVLDSMDLVDDDEAAGGEAAGSSDAPKPSDGMCGEERGQALYHEGVKELSEQDDEDPDVQRGFHVQRALEFPGKDNCALAHESTAEHRRMCPYCCTSEVELDPAAAAPVAAAVAAPVAVDDEQMLNDDVDGAVVAARLSSAASIIWPDAMEACMWYKPQVLVQWAVGCGAFIEPGQGVSVMLGTRAIGGLFEHKKRGNGPSGAQRVDVAWLQANESMSGNSEWAKSWRKMADLFSNQKSHTIDMFDVHRDGLGELLWLLSTKDNARRIADEPRLPPSTRPVNCTRTKDDKRIGEKDCVAYMSPFADPRPGQTGNIGDSTNPKPPEHGPRDQHSGVANIEWQRRLDTLMHAGRLAALNPLISNRVVVSSPIRMNPESGVELNVGALHAHTMLLAESVLACATMPGLRNAQEPFCNGQSGPEGLSAERQEPKPGDKKKKRTVPDADVVRMLPYSYDVISIAIAEDAALMLYDDKGATWLAGAKESEPSCTLTFDNLPHLSLRYLGYLEHNRQTLSIKLGATRREGQPYIEAGDPSVSESFISEAHVRRSLGREVSSYAEMAAYIGRKQGARSMGKVKGDLFAMSTWYDHCILSLQSRGLISGSIDEPAPVVYCEMQHCITMRIYEDLCVRKDPDFVGYGLKKARPSTYDVSEVAVDDEASRRQKRKTSLPTTVVDSYDFDSNGSALYKRLMRGRAPRPARSARGGAGSSNDVLEMDAAPHAE